MVFVKVLDQWKPNLIWIITRVSSFKIVSGDAVHQPTWPLLLKIEHMVKLQDLYLLQFLKYKTESFKILQIWWKKGNNSKMGNQIYFKMASFTSSLFELVSRAFLVRKLFKGKVEY
jgi:hypothetical protein